MPAHIILDYPERRALRRLWRRTVALVGALLVIAGLLASAIPILVLMVVIASLVSGDQELPTIEPDMVRLLVGATAAAVVGLLFGLRLIRGKRRLVLFLRRFGFVGATHVVSFAVARAVGRTWRLVTLDDLHVAPVGVSRRTRRLAGFGGLIGVAIMAGAALWIFGGGFKDFLRDAFDQMAPEGKSFAETMGNLIGSFVAVLVVGALVLAFVLLVAAFFGAATLFSWSSYRAVRKAERSKAREIRTPQQIEGTVRSVARRSRRILGARLVVVRVASEIWQPVVRRLAADSSAIVVDVSEPTENLLWELDALEAQFRSRRILVGDRARLEYLASPGKAATRGQLFERLATYLDGEEILAYEGESRRDMKRFAVGLRARLERAG